MNQQILPQNSLCHHVLACIYRVCTCVSVSTYPRHLAHNILAFYLAFSHVPLPNHKTHFSTLKSNQ